MARSANPAAGTVALDAAKHDGFGNTQFLALGQDGLVQRFSLPAIVFSEMNAQHAPGKLFFHGCFLLRSATGHGGRALLSFIDGTVGVLDNVDVGEDDQALLDHLVHHGQEGAKLIGGIDSREHHRAVVC